MKRQLISHQDKLFCVEEDGRMFFTKNNGFNWEEIKPPVSPQKVKTSTGKVFTKFDVKRGVE